MQLEIHLGNIMSMSGFMLDSRYGVLNMMQLIAKKGLFVVLFLNPALLMADTSDLDTEMQILQQVCPVRWEQLNVMMNAEQVEEGNIWADYEDYLAWHSYLNTLAEAQNLSSDDIIRMSQDELAVITECMAQRVKVMLMLGGTPLGDSGVAYLNDVEVIAAQPESSKDNITLGSLSTYPASSCQAIKQEVPNAESGIYWVQLTSLNLIDTYRVFCDMDHDGGGWMYWGYAGKSADLSNLFEQASTTYDIARRKPEDSQVTNNVFPLNQFADTEMIFSIGTPDINEAKTLKKYVRYRYAVDAPMFNAGPLPCQSSEFEYTIDDTNFYSANHACSSAEWYPKTSSGAYLSLVYTGNYGVYWGTGMGGNNSWYHSAWVYVR